MKIFLKIGLGFLAFIFILLALFFAERWWLSHKPLHKGFNLISKSSLAFTGTPYLNEYPFTLQSGDIILFSSSLKEKPLIFNPKTRKIKIGELLNPETFHIVKNRAVINNYTIVDPYKVIYHPLGNTNIAIILSDWIASKYSDEILPPLLLPSGHILLRDTKKILDLEVRKIHPAEGIFDVKEDLYYLGLSKANSLLFASPITNEFFLIEGAKIKLIKKCRGYKFEPESRISRLLNGDFLITGGFSRKGKALDVAILFDSNLCKFTKLPYMQEARVGHISQTLEDGRVLIAGGRGYAENKMFSNSSEFYDPVKRYFFMGPRMVTPRFQSEAILMTNNNMLIINGYLKQGNDFDIQNNSIEIYAP